MIRAAARLAASLACVLLAACATSSQSAPNPLEKARQRIAGDWTLASLDGRDASARARAADAREIPSLAIQEDGRTGGAAGVNRWFSQLDMSEVAQGRFALAAIGSTKMAGPPEAMSLEDDFLDALARARSFDAQALAEDRLVLLDEDGDALMELERAVQAAR